MADEIKPGGLFGIVEAGPWEGGGPAWTVVAVFNFGRDEDLIERLTRETPAIWPDDASRGAMDSAKEARGSRWAPSRRTLEGAMHDKASASRLTLAAMLATMRVFREDMLYVRPMFFVT